MQKASLQSQQGMSYWGVIATIVALILIGKLGLVTGPAYFDNRTLNSTIEDKLAEAGNKSASKVLLDIENQMGINSTSSLKIDEVIQVVNKTPGNIQLKTDYEVRETLFANVDVVSHFQKEFSQK